MLLQRTHPLPHALRNVSPPQPTTFILQYSPQKQGAFPPWEFLQKVKWRWSLRAGDQKDEQDHRGAPRAPGALRSRPRSDAQGCAKRLIAQRKEFRRRSGKQQFCRAARADHALLPFQSPEPPLRSRSRSRLGGAGRTNSFPISQPPRPKTNSFSPSSPEPSPGRAQPFPEAAPSPR